MSDNIYFSDFGSTAYGDLYTDYINRSGDIAAYAEATGYHGYSDYGYSDGLAGPNPVGSAIEAIAADPNEISARFDTLTVNTVSSGQQLKPAVARDDAGNF